MSKHKIHAAIWKKKGFTRLFGVPWKTKNTSYYSYELTGWVHLLITKRIINIKWWSGSVSTSIKAVFCCWSGWFMCLLSQCHNSPLSVNITQIHILCTADSPEIRLCSAQEKNKTKSWQHNLKKDWSHRECCSWRNHKTAETMYFGQMRPKMTFGHDARHHVWQKPNTAYQDKHRIPAVEHGGEQWWFGLALHLQCRPRTLCAKLF